MMHDHGSTPVHILGDCKDCPTHMNPQQVTFYTDRNNPIGYLCPFCAASRLTDDLTKKQTGLETMGRDPAQ